MRKELTILGLLYLISPAAAEMTTTDINTVWMLLAMGIVFFVIGLFTWGSGGVTAVSIGTMLIPTIISFKVSNLFIDGTLTTTERFLSSTNEVVTATEVIRNSAVSQVFQLIGIVISITILLQIYQFIKESKVVEEI
ncbi:MAG: hypothetical protein M0R51_14840 [Clostridia bacterium]|jgi:membrane-bound ClpP family serine protease|nr:hypothetical protein [Clostridia bacterium]